MIVAVASGKGGTGKTTLSSNLARVLSSNVKLLDCDVEEPNCHLFLPGKTEAQEIVTTLVPVVDETLCDACGECSRFCEFNAIVSIKTAPLVFPELCHSCGGCMRVCPKNAITEEPKRIGSIDHISSGPVRLVQGRLDVGIVSSPPLIRAVKERADKNEITIIDAPPGASCPVVTALRGCDYVVLVTEPTPFGLHDLEIAVATVRQMDLPFGVVVNRSGSGDDRVRDFCQAEKIPLLAEIPDDRRIAEAYSRGQLLVEALPEYRDIFRGLWRRIESEVPSARSAS